MVFMKSIIELLKDFEKELVKNGYPAHFTEYKKTDRGFCVTYNCGSESGTKSSESRAICPKIEKEYVSARDVLKELYVDREIPNKLIAMSMFWHPCIDDAYSLLMQEERTRENFNYNSAVEYLTDVAKAMADGIWNEGYGQGRFSVHTEKDKPVVENLIKNDMMQVLKLNKGEVKEKLNVSLKALDRYKDTLSEMIRFPFMEPLIKKLSIKDNDAEKQLIALMISTSFTDYLDKYKNKGTGYYK